MSGFLRPEVRALLWRWREALVAAGATLLGIWIALRPGPVMAGFGWLVAAVGVVVLVLAIRRARFVSPGMGPGVVHLDEGQINYLGPFYGGSVAIAQMTALSLRRAADGKAYWVLTDAEQVLVIPANAAGAETLFDAFTTLPGLAMGAVLAAVGQSAPGTVTLWSVENRPALTP